MNAKEAAGLVRAISNSIKNNPGQFHLDITVTGLSVASHGGIGMISSATGGGPGSTTIGTNVDMGRASVGITQGQQAMDEQFKQLTKTLDAMASHLEAVAPDKSAIDRLYRSLLHNWVPGVITSVIGSALSVALGIAP